MFDYTDSMFGIYRDIGQVSCLVNQGALYLYVFMRSVNDPDDTEGVEKKIK